MDRKLFEVSVRDLVWKLAGMLLLSGVLWLKQQGAVPPVVPPDQPLPVPPSPGAPGRPPRPEPKLDAVQALARYSADGVGCTCTVLGPTPKQGYVAVLTANHCVGRVGRRFSVILKDGRRYEAICIATDREADCALAVIKTDDSMAYAKIAQVDPEPGVKVWQAGYGVGKPEKRYDGVVTKIGPAQTAMNIRFFSGDSGGGIFRDDTNELVSVVCCTNGPQGWGATVKRIRQMIQDAEKRYTSDGYTLSVEKESEIPEKEKEK